MRAGPTRLTFTDHGAARAAEATGRKQKAKTFHDQLAAMCGGRLTARPSIHFTEAPHLSQLSMVTVQSTKRAEVPAANIGGWQQ